MARISLEHITRHFEGNPTPAVVDLSLEIPDHEFLVLVGPSGCGKSTILRSIAGLEVVDSGRIFIGDSDVTRLQPRHRDVAMIFQNYALYPHLNVAENIGFHLKLKRSPKETIRTKVSAAAETLELLELLKRKPAKLSGGQRQRVAMGRAIVREPSVFLMDEPLSNLDAQLRLEMRTEIVELQRRLGTTTVYVTHDQVEAMTMGTQVAVLKDGVLQQCASPQELYESPTNSFVARFVGSPPMNMVEVSATQIQSDGSFEFLGERRTVERTHIGGGLLIGCRPEDMEIATDRGTEARVSIAENLGFENLIHAVLQPNAPKPTPVVVRESGGPRRHGGEQIRVRMRPGRPLHVFEAGMDTDTGGVRLGTARPVS